MNQLMADLQYQIYYPLDIPAIALIVLRVFLRSFAAFNPGSEISAYVQLNICAFWHPISHLDREDGNEMFVESLPNVRNLYFVVIIQ